MDFYNETNHITIYHEINGKPYIVRYGELFPNSIKHRKGDKVMQGDKLGETGALIGYGVLKIIVFGKPMRMLHFEVFNIEINGISIDDLKRINKYMLTTSCNGMSKKEYNRRKDIINPLEILKQGYEASKKSGLIK